MIEALQDAQGELRRVDHLVYVSLKYTRTADVLKNTINRMILFYEQVVQALLLKAVEDEKLEEISISPIQKADQLIKLHDKDITIKENMELYLGLRKMSRAKFTKREEYRRHLTMTVFLEGGVKRDVTMDSVKEDYLKQVEFFDYAKEMIIPTEDD